jgi:hypothetical protein
VPAWFRDQLPPAQMSWAKRRAPCRHHGRPGGIRAGSTGTAKRNRTPHSPRRSSHTRTCPSAHRAGPAAEHRRRRRPSPAPST